MLCLRANLEIRRGNRRALDLGVRRRRGGREGDQCDPFRPPTASLRLPGQSWTRFGRAEGAERSLSSALAPQGPSPSSARAPVRGRASGFDALVPLSERTSSPDPAGPMMPGREFPTNVRAKMRDRSTPDRTDSPCFPRAGRSRVVYGDFLCARPRRRKLRRGYRRCLLTVYSSEAECPNRELVMVRLVASLLWLGR